MPPTTAKADSSDISSDAVRQNNTRRARKDRTISPLVKQEDVKQGALIQPKVNYVRLIGDIGSVRAADELQELRAAIFQTDLEHMRNLVTCSICDQLLYEPFTIQCGHTYCYSVSWK